MVSSSITGKCNLIGHIHIKKITLTAVINIVFQRIFIKNLTFRTLVHIHFHMKRQVLYKNALEYNVYHCCLCDFLNQTTMA